MKSDRREATCCKVQNNTVSSFQCMLEAVGELSVLQWITIPYNACPLTAEQGSGTDPSAVQLPLSHDWKYVRSIDLLQFNLGRLTWAKLHSLQRKSSTANTRPCPEQSAPVGTPANVYRANKESENIVIVNNSHYAPWTCITPKAHHKQQTIHKCKNKTHMPLQ